jgi:hypothetical protein
LNAKAAELAKTSFDYFVFAGFARFAFNVVAPTALTADQNVTRPPTRSSLPMTITEGRPRDEPMVVTALVTVLWSLFFLQELSWIDASSSPCRPVRAGQGAETEQDRHDSGQFHVE